jgi:hypothetical protein
MFKIAVGGLNKKEMEQAILQAARGGAKVIVTTDIQAGQMIKRGEVDYYLGACNSGGGAAISILIGMLGYQQCCTVAKAGQRPDPQLIQKFAAEGKIAFGMAVESISTAVPMVIQALLRQENIQN